MEANFSLKNPAEYTLNTEFHVIIRLNEFQGPLGQSSAFQTEVTVGQKGGAKGKREMLKVRNMFFA